MAPPTSEGGYRKGVKVGNYVEELAASGSTAPFLLTTGGAPSSTDHATTTSQAAFPAHTTPVPVREDLKLKYIKYGRTEPLGNETGPPFMATMSQLAFARTPTAIVQPSNVEGAAATAPLRAQDCLWTASNAGNTKVPRAVEAQTKTQARAQRLAAEQGRSVYVSAGKESLEAAAASPARATARQVQCRPKAEGGQEAQVGRKATGEFRKLMEKDFWNIGLRK